MLRVIFPTDSNHIAEHNFFGVCNGERFYSLSGRNFIFLHYKPIRFVVFVGPAPFVFARTGKVFVKFYISDI